MEKSYMLGIDIGSGGCKITIVDKSGNVAATAFKEYPTDYPHTGWAEQHPATSFLRVPPSIHRGTWRTTLQTQVITIF